MAECSSGVEKHAGPVWQIHWVTESSHKGESLFTAAADGRVCQWDYTKVATSSVWKCNIVLGGNL